MDDKVARRRGRLGIVRARFEELLCAFGAPRGETDGTRVDVRWQVEVDDGTAWIGNPRSRRRVAAVPELKRWVVWGDAPAIAHVQKRLQELRSGEG